MPGTPATSPNFVIPRFSNADAADFSTDVNSVVDAIDANVQAALILRTKLLIRTVPANTTAVAGDLIVFTGFGPATITLPAPAANALVGVYASGSISGASPLTISAGSAQILGPGVASTSAFMGTINSYVLLQSNGTNWLVVGGSLDTGWVPLTLHSGFSTAGGQDAPAVRRIGDMCYLRGNATNNSAGTLAGGSTLFTFANSLFNAGAAGGAPVAGGIPTVLSLFVGSGAIASGGGGPSVPNGTTVWIGGCYAAS